MPRGIPKSKNPEAYQTQELNDPARARTLAHKERDLAAWEESLAKRQGLYDNAEGGTEHKLKLLEGKIIAKLEELEQIEAKLKARRISADTEAKKLGKLTNNAQELHAHAREGLDRVLDEVKQRGEEGAKAVGRLKEVEREIKERKAYQIEQEDLIDKSAQEGNQQLSSIHREIKEAEREREELLGKIHVDTLKAGALESQIGERQEDITRLTLRYDEAVKEYRANLVALKLEIGDAETARDRTVAETNEKLLELKAERAELEVSREVVQKQKEEVFAERRRLDSMRTQYGM